MTWDPTTQRLFKPCAYCGLTRLSNFYGRRWLCDDCATEHLGETAASTRKDPT